jgi:hypothetical protein
MTQHHDSPHTPHSALEPIARALFFVRVIMPLAMVGLFVANCVSNRRSDAVQRLVEQAGGAGGLAVTKRATGHYAGEYHIGSAIYLAPDIHFEVLTRVVGKTRVYHWKAKLGEGVAAGDALSAAMVSSMQDSAERSRGEAGALVLWGASDASEWANHLDIPVLAAAPQLVRVLQ